MLLEEQITDIKNWALIQQQYSIDELFELEQYGYQDASPKLIKRALKEIVFEDRCLAIQNWLKSLDKAIDELVAQEKYDYIHADPKFIKNVIKTMQDDDFSSKESEINLHSPLERKYEEETSTYNLLYNGMIIVGTIAIGILIIRCYRHPFLFEALQTLLRNNQANDEAIQELNSIDQEEGKQPHQVVGLVDDQIQPGGEGTPYL